MSTYRITTKTGNANLTTLEYAHAEQAVEGGFLLVTHRDSGGKKMLSKIPLANIVQIMEALPEVTS